MYHRRDRFDVHTRCISFYGEEPHSSSSLHVEFISDSNSFESILSELLLASSVVVGVDFGVTYLIRFKSKRTKAKKIVFFDDILLIKWCAINNIYVGITNRFVSGENMRRTIHGK